jgi:ribonuclease HII
MISRGRKVKKSQVPGASQIGIVTAEPCDLVTPPLDPWAYERDAWSCGYSNVAGVDEAGRGPLAGPVVAAAVILPEDFDCNGICDSKVMTPASRDRAYDRIRSQAKAVGVGIIGPEVIDEINILRATHRAMNVALESLALTQSDEHATFDFVLVDGLPVASIPGPSLAIVKGDSKSVSIMAASIIAKVTRDRIMIETDRDYPQYGFKAHKGYYCTQHIEAIHEHGPCPCHRRSFSPIAERIANCPLPGLE